MAPTSCLLGLAPVDPLLGMVQSKSCADVQAAVVVKMWLSTAFAQGYNDWAELGQVPSSSMVAAPQNQYMGL